MTEWVLVPDLISLRDELNTAFPDRDHASDGTIGDLAHQQESSDHNPDETGRTPYEDADSINEVHAFDADDDLRKPGWTMHDVVDIVVSRHRAGLDARLQNVIYDRQIASRSWGWTWREYTGLSPHTEHAHFSARYGSGDTQSNPENVIKPWGILAAVQAKEEAEMTTVDLTDAALADVRTAAKNGVYDAFASAKGAADDDPSTVSDSYGRGLRDFLNTVIDYAESGGPLVATLLAALASLDTVDETALAAALGPVIVANLAPQIIAALPPGSATAADVQTIVEDVIGRTGLAVHPTT